MNQLVVFGVVNKPFSVDGQQAWVRLLEMLVEAEDGLLLMRGVAILEPALDPLLGVDQRVVGHARRRASTSVWRGSSFFALTIEWRRE